MLENPRARIAEDGQTVRLVDHEPGSVTSLNLNEPRQIGEVAIHAVEAFHGDQDALVAVARRGEESSNSSRSLCGNKRRSARDSVPPMTMLL